MDPQVGMGPVRWFRRLALIATLATYALIVIGGIVRVTGSGLGCPDWPLCHGQIIPPLEATAIIEYSHRLAAALSSLAIIVTTVFAVLRFRREAAIFRPMLLVVGLLVIQIVLGGITVLNELPPAVVAVHLGNSLLILAALWVATYNAYQLSASSATPPVAADAVALDGRREGYGRLVFANSVAVYALIVIGAVVAGSGAGPACLDLPFCQGQLFPANSLLGQIHMIHRLATTATGLLLAYTITRTWRDYRGDSRLTKVSLITGILFLGQALAGLSMVIWVMPAWSRGLHVALAAATWSGIIMWVLSVYQPARGRATRQDGRRVARRAEAGDKRRSSILQPSSLAHLEAEQTYEAAHAAQIPAQDAAQAAAAQDNVRVAAEDTSPPTWRDYFRLTKPWIIVLLLVTTLGGMFIAQQGMPPLGLMLATLLGGFMAAGGANAMNSYIDRDIDAVMSRTSRRPMPNHRIPPRHALLFSLALCLGSILTLGFFANWLASMLAFGGYVYYVVVYTLWLKRTTPHNIVIGGAAGAIPPIVGWVAVTNHLELGALLLFAIVFYWTPPHTWALMLMIKNDYARVNVPMLPVVKGDTETIRQILLYTLIMLIITFLPFVIRLGSIVYLLLALLLGGWFLILAIQLWRDRSKKTALRLYKYSMLYLALIFMALALDRAIVPQLPVLALPLF
ncbi:MAG: protoheme IX farnesyltransferase [Chloroflexi bacterium]|nr:protoheme IX farnesyltransferase [Chloroflexota bacterium]